MTDAQDRVGRDERGMTLVELIIAMTITTLVLGVVTAGVISLVRTDQFVEEDSQALRQLRTVMADFTKELRGARIVFPGTGTNTSTARRINFWNDRDHDNVQDTNELIIWELVASGTRADMVRRTAANTTNVTRARDIVLADAFTYLGITSAGKVTLAPPNTTLVRVTVSADVSARHGRARTIRTEVRLRNAATRTAP